jgi:membrane fusion protein (multidrug efflux system)
MANESPERLFRAEAVAYHAQPREDGALLEIAPSWARQSFRLLLGVLLCALLYLILGRAHEYASGPAILRVEGRTDLTARVAGVVSAVLVHPGERVRAGQPLMQFFMEQESAELERIKKEQELQLLKLLRDPSDQAARAALTTLRAERELATARLSLRLVRAPHAGVVSDVRIRSGESLMVGDLVVTLLPEDATLSLVALLPGRYRPMLRAGQPLRFELEGYRYEYRELPIDEVGDAVIGPHEAQRYLGPDLADSVQLQGPVVLVRAHLPWRSFVSDGRAFDYYDGLHAWAQVRVRSERIARLLLPGFGEASHGR